MYGKEGLFAPAGGGPGSGGGGSGFPGPGGVPPAFFGGSPGGPGGATFFSFGGDGFRDGGMGSAGAGFGGFTDPRDLFEGLFGGAGQDGSGRTTGGAPRFFDGLFGSSFDDLSGMHGLGRQGRAAGRRDPRGRSDSGVPVQKEFWCSLKELYEGCDKKMKVTDSIRDPFTGQTRWVSHVYKISVKPGWKEGTKITFPPTSDGLCSICFVLRQRPHRYLSREGDCLVYECCLTEKQARKGVKISVPLLSESDAPIELTVKGNDAYDGKEMLLPALGMPVKGGAPGQRGSFKVKFKLQHSGKAFAA